jgi:hypothetical protein
MEERRRFTAQSRRGALDGGPFAESVRILDLSASGAPAPGSGAVGVRSKALLRLSVGGSPFAAEIEVMRVGPAPQPSDGIASPRSSWQSRRSIGSLSNGLSANDGCSRR